MKGKPLAAPRQVQGKLDVLHEVVRRACEEAQSHEHGDQILGLAEGFRPFARQKLLPETRLLLSLLPGIAREKQTAKAFQGLARLRDLLNTLQAGEPLQQQGMTVFPLLFPEVHDPSHALLEPAIEQGTAVVEEVTEDGDVPNLRVTNNGDLPILIPER